MYFVIDIGKFYYPALFLALFQCYFAAYSYSSLFTFFFLPHIFFLFVFVDCELIFSSS